MRGREKKLDSIQVSGKVLSDRIPLVLVVLFFL